MATHIFQWDEERGCIPFSSSATGVWTATSSAAVRDGKYFCAHCGRPMNRGGTMQHIFRHVSSEDEARCNRRILEHAAELSSLSSPQLSIGLRYTENSLSLYLSFYSLTNGSAYPPEAKITIHIGKRNAVHAAALLTRNKGTMLRAPVPAAQYTISYQGFREGETRYWPEKVEGPDPDGAFFDSALRLLRPGTRIPLDTAKEYYFLTVRPLEETSKDLVVRHLCLQPQNETVIWHLYRISVLRFSLSAATFFLDHGIFPMTERPSLVPVWPPCVERQNFLLHHAGSLYFSVRNGEASPRTYPHCSLRQIKDIPSKTAELYQVSGSNQDLLLDGGIESGLGYYWCRKTALRGSTTPPEVVVVDTEGKPVEGDLPALPEDGSLIVRPPYTGMVRVYHSGALWCVYPLEGNRDTFLPTLTPDMELHIYQGADLVRTLRFAQEESHAAEAPEQQSEPAVQQKPPKAPALTKPKRSRKRATDDDIPEFPVSQDPLQADASLGSTGSNLVEILQRLQDLKGCTAEGAPVQDSPVSQSEAAGTPEKLAARSAQPSAETVQPPLEVPAIETPKGKTAVSPEVSQSKPAISQTRQDHDTALLARLQACSSRAIPIPHTFGACASLFSPAVQHWIAGKVREKKIPADAYRLLVHESNLRQGGQANGR